MREPVDQRLLCCEDTVYIKGCSTTASRKQFTAQCRQRDNSAHLRSVILVISTYTSYRLISQNLPQSLERVSKQPDVARETEYYLSKIGQIKSVDDFMTDSRIYNYALKAHGLEDMAYAKAFIRKVLTEGPTNENSFANQLIDKRYLELAKTFNFADHGEVATTFTKVQKGVVDSYMRTTLEVDAGTENTGVRLALYFERNVSKIKSAMDILADDAFSEVFRTAFQLPPEVAASDIDKQAALIEKSLNIADLQDPAKLHKFLERFTVMWDLNNQPADNNSLSILGASAGHGISADLLLSINNLKLGGK